MSTAPLTFRGSMNTHVAARIGLAVSMATLLVLAQPAGAQDPDPEAREEVREQRPPRTKISLDYQYYRFDRTFSAWHLSSGEVSRRGTMGTLIGRFNHARRFDRNGTQFEVDAYPRIAKGTYGYLNVGYAPEALFPEWRAGGELFRSLPGSFEASLGSRWLKFGSKDVVIYTGSVGKYVGNYWISARPFVTPKDDGTSVTAIVTARRYYADADHYMGVSVGYGTSPADLVSEVQLTRDHKWKAAFEGKASIQAPLRFVWRLSYDREEFARTDRLDRWGVKIGLERDF